MSLLTEFKRLQTRYIILDTQISTLDHPVIYIRKENSFKEGAAIPDSIQIGNAVIVGRPSKSALELMLNSLGFDFDYYDWENSGIKNWEFLEDYHSKKRILFKKAFRYGGKVIKDFKNRPKNVRAKIAPILSTRRITLVAKNRSFD